MPISDLRSFRVYLHYFIYRAYLNLQVQFKQTKFGFLWDPLSLLVVSFMISMLWSIVLGERNFLEFFAYIISGYAVWMLISSLVDSASSMFIRNQHLIANEYQPLHFYCMNNVVMHLMRFVLILPLVILLLAYLGKLEIMGNLLYFLAAIFFIVLFGTGVGFLLGTLALFFRDIKFLMSAIMRLAFLLTPIIWKVERLGEYESFIFLNPFYPYLEACRSALIEDEVDRLILLIVAAEASVIFLTGLLVVRLCENNIRRRVFKT